jgi:hypothetical protein
VTRDPSLTGDPHVDARLEAWRPETRPLDPQDRLPSPGRERRAGIGLAVLVAIAIVIAIGYLVIALLGSGVAPG